MGSQSSSLWTFPHWSLLAPHFRLVGTLVSATEQHSQGWHTHPRNFMSPYEIHTSYTHRFKWRIFLDREMASMGTVKLKENGSTKKWSTKNYLFIIYNYHFVCICVCKFMSWHVCEGQKTTLWSQSLFLLSCGFWELNWGFQACLISTELTHWLQVLIF